MLRSYPTSLPGLGADVGGGATGDAYELVEGRREHAVRVAARCPDLVVLTEIDVDNRADRCGVTDRRDAPSGLCNPCGFRGCAIPMKSRPTANPDPRQPGSVTERPTSPSRSPHERSLGPLVCARGQDEYLTDRYQIATVKRFKGGFACGSATNR